MLRSSKTQLLTLLPASLLLAACAGSGPAPSAESPSNTEAVELSVLTYNIWHDRRDWPARREIGRAHV